MASIARPQRRPQKYTETASELVDAIEADGFANLKAGSNGSKTARPGGGRLASSESSSSTLTNEEDFDNLKPDPNTTIEGSKGGGLEEDATLQPAHRSTTELDALDNNHLPKGVEKALLRRRTSIPVRLEKTNTKGKYLLSADDPDILEILRRGAQRELEGGKKRRSRFSDLVFTRQFTAFDRQNPLAYDSPFHGFFTLFWMGTFLMLLKVAASNWKQYGSIFGRNEIVEMMISRDVVLLGLTDGIMCASTGFCLLLQLVIYRGWLSWSGSGWIIQNVRPIFPLASNIIHEFSGKDSHEFRPLDFCIITSMD
jgi:sterol O-acyltransferase